MKTRVVPIAIVGALLCASLACRAQTTTAASQPAATAPSADALAVLTMLQNRDQTLKDFTATIQYDVYHLRTDDTERQKGDVSYLKDADATKFAVHFTVQGSGQPPTFQYQKVDHTLVFDGRWIIDSDADAKVFQKTQIVPPGAEAKSLKLGEGPLPLPIGQDTQKVARDFDVILLPTDPKLPNATDLTHLRLVPRNADLCKLYDMNSLEIWVSKAQQLPLKLAREGLDGNTTTITLDNVKINQGAAKIFNLPTPKSSDGWDVRIETLDPNKAGK